MSDLREAVAQALQDEGDWWKLNCREVADVVLGVVHEHAECITFGISDFDNLWIRRDDSMVPPTHPDRPDFVKLVFDVEALGGSEKP